MAEYYFERDDKLNRRQYGLFLETVLEQCDQYRRDGSDGAYIIAIDSAWGTGKSYFLSMLKNHLENRTPQTDPDALPPSDAHYFVVPYNAWAYDYWGNALEPLMYTILQSQAFELENAEKSTADTVENIKRLGIEIVKGASTAFLNKAIGQNATAGIINAIQTMNGESKDLFQAFEEEQKNHSYFQAALSSILKIYGKKLVVLVDELDRCKPIFAIQTLEAAKHLFNASGVVFIFALDIEQLSHSVKQVYGAGMDASGYLCRFFDYIGKMLTKPETKSRFVELCKGIYGNRHHFIERLLAPAKMENLSLGISNTQEDPTDAVRIISADQRILNYSTEESGRPVYPTGLVPQISWGNLLFSSDLPNWEQIKYLTPAQYIFQQLEMFSFALTPPDNMQSNEMLR